MLVEGRISKMRRTIDMKLHLRYGHRIVFYGGMLLNSEVKPFFDSQIPEGESDAFKSKNRDRIEI